MTWTQNPDGSLQCGPVSVRDQPTPIDQAAGWERWHIFVGEQRVSRPGGYSTARKAMRAAFMIAACRAALGLPPLNRKGAKAGTGHLSLADAPGPERDKRAVRAVLAKMREQLDKLEILVGGEV